MNADTPKIKRFAELVGEVSIQPANERETRWRVAVLHDGREVDLDERFDTPGVALDAAIEWANDRGLKCEWIAHPFHLIRPGELEAS